MSHTDFTTALGRLLSDAELLGQFLQDPHGACNSLHVSDTDRDALLQLNSLDLAAQATTLLDKRWHEVRAILPMTMAMLAKSGYVHFMHYATSHWPTGHQRHWHDAACFYQYLKTYGLSRQEAEGNRVQFVLTGKYLAFAVIAYPREKVWQQRALQILLRLRTRPHEFRLYLAGF